MNDYEIIFSLRAQARLKEIADYLYRQHMTKEFVVEYLNGFQRWLETVLLLFPESGTPMPDFGEGIRRVVYQKYSVVYRVRAKQIEILTLYRENLP